jgi:hypothetical protein
MRRLSIAISTHTARGVGCRNVVPTTFLVGLKEVDSPFFLCPTSAYPLNRTGGDFLGSSADVIVGHFAIHYHNDATILGINLDELYAAQLRDAEVTPLDWDIQGRQAGVYK